MPSDAKFVLKFNKILAAFLAVIIWAVACQPFLRHLFKRVTVAEEFAGLLLVLATVAGLAWSRKRSSFQPPRSEKQIAASWWCAACLLLCYAGLTLFLPQTIAGMAALLAFLLTPGPWQRDNWFDPSIAALLLLTLPAMLMLELFLGYPLRLVATVIARNLLTLPGLPITREGVSLIWNGNTIWVDAPCSGIRMLWGGAWFGLTLCGVFRLGWMGVITGSVWTLITIVLANAVRVAGLVMVEGGLLPSGMGYHYALGIAVFISAAAMIAIGIKLLSKLPLMRPKELSHEPICKTNSEAAKIGRKFNTAYLGYLSAGVIAALLTYKFTGSVTRDHVSADFIGWPDSFEGTALCESELTKEEQAFNAAFPGKIGRFTCGDKIVIMRWVECPTYRIHSAIDCLRSVGWTLADSKLESLPSGLWTKITVVKGDAKLHVRERCEAPDGQTWSDVSGWFWATLAGSTKGPWWFVTVVTQAKND